MKSLESYIKENQQISLSEYIVNEGLFGWLKKLWDWMFNSVDKNVKENKGSYVLPKEANKEVKSKSPKIELIFAKLKSKDFEEKIIDKTNSKDKSGAFYEAWDYYSKNPKELIYSFNDKNWGPMGFQFCKENNEQIVRTKMFWCTSIIDDLGSEFLSKCYKQFYAWVKKNENKEVIALRS